MEFYYLVRLKIQINLPSLCVPVLFLTMLMSTKASAVVFNVLSTMSLGMIASATTDFPRPLIQLRADGFLSVHILLLKVNICISGNSSFKYFRVNSVALETIFIPIASPVKASNLIYSMFELILTKMFFKRAKREVLSNCF